MCVGTTAHHKTSSLGGGIPASDDGIFQLSNNRDEIEGRAGAGHRDARDGHGIQGIETMIYALPGEGLVLSEHQGDEGGL